MQYRPKYNVQMGILHKFYHFRKMSIWPTSNTVRDITILRLPLPLCHTVSRW